MSVGAPSRDVWVFDSFEGLPEPGREDCGASTGWERNVMGPRRTSMRLPAIRRPKPVENDQGWFQDTFPQVSGEVGDVALLHADGDWYESVLLTLETFYPKLTPGGYVVIDDYNFWAGAQRAADEFRGKQGIHDRLIQIDGNAVYWQKS
jgi:O-methyltransferase